MSLKNQHNVNSWCADEVILCILPFDAGLLRPGECIFSRGSSFQQYIVCSKFAMETTNQMLQLLFVQYPGFKEVRMIEAKPGIAFVEYEDEVQAGMAMQHLQGFKITAQNPMSITYAKNDNPANY
ncbi:hypothetical protein SAY86_018223 [Trapa natans]|uniref:RRM domain-containing protein n=1 Tax=Trapa natans TaxID=22666 RepID=A0AAN7LEQ6_TRANT|nr:hypothetical protein SAY86_018223 [Trapa natans]